MKPEDRRKFQLAVLLTLDEKRWITAQAEAEDMTISEWVRRRMLRGKPRG